MSPAEPDAPLKPEAELRRLREHERIRREALVHRDALSEALQRLIRRVRLDIQPVEDDTTDLGVAMCEAVKALQEHG